MSPLVAAPNRGYGDYQRIANWDSGVQWSVSSALGNANIQSPVLDFSRAAYIGGFMNVTGNPLLVSIGWCADPGFTVFMGTRQFIVSPLMGFPAMLRIPNLGPFAQITVQSITGNNFQLFTQILSTNRVHPLEFIPRQPVVVDQQNVAVAANVSVPVYPTDYYSGPMSVWVDFNQAGMNASLQALNSVNVWDFIDERPPTTVAGVATYVMVAPPGAWRFLVTNNNAAATNYYLTATPSTTGAS
jgi:hypothetical protein